MRIVGPAGRIAATAGCRPPTTLVQEKHHHPGRAVAHSGSVMTLTEEGDTLRLVSAVLCACRVAAVLDGEHQVSWRAVVADEETAAAAVVPPHHERKLRPAAVAERDLGVLCVAVWCECGVCVCVLVWGGFELFV